MANLAEELRTHGGFNLTLSDEFSMPAAFKEAIMFTTLTERDTQSIVRDGIGDANISAVGLEGDAVVAIEDLPSAELDL